MGGYPLKVLWGEGMFLRPQHFQQFSSHVEQQLNILQQCQQSFFAGVSFVQFDEQSLSQGILRLTKLAAVFKDGERVNCPESGPLPPSREINQLPVNEHGSIVYACLPSYNLSGSNAANGDAINSDVRTRYLSSNKNVADLFTRAIDAPITTLHANLRLMTEDENRDGMLSIAIGKLIKKGHQWSMCPDFMPCATSLEANTALNRKIQHLLGMLLQKSAALSTQHRQKTDSLSDFGTNDIASFWLLHSVNRMYPLLNHLCRQADTHPEVFYRLLCESAGELLTFSSTKTLTDIPQYNHEHQGKTFGALIDLIHEMIDTVIGDKYVVFPLSNPKTSFYIAHILDERMLNDMDFYLSVQSNRATREIAEIIPLRIKVGSPDDVETIVNSALSGVSLMATQQVPAGIPVRVANQYFALDPKSPLFKKMITSRSVCIYVPQLLSDIEFELIGVYR